MKNICKKPKKQKRDWKSGFGIILKMMPNTSARLLAHIIKLTMCQ
jgi:hypothetical protein